MRVPFLICVILSLSILSSATAISVTKNFSEFKEGNQAIIKIFINNSEDVKYFDIVQLVPRDWEITNWSINGVNNVKIENYNNYYYNNNYYNVYHWLFRDINSKTFELEYKTIPKKAGQFNIVNIWLCPIGFAKEESTINVIGK